MNSTEKIQTSELNGPTTDNTKVGGTQAVERTPNYLKYDELPSTVMLAILSAVGVCANALIITIIVRNKKLQRPANYYILSNCVNDWTIAAFSVNCLNFTYYIGRWKLSYALCWIWTWFDYSSSMVSLIHLTLLARDRYEAIVNPLTYASPNKKIRIGVSIAVTYVGSFGLILALCIAYVRPSYTAQCTFSSYLTFDWTFTLVGLVAPFLSMLIFYARCALALHLQYWKQRKLQPAVNRILPSQGHEETTTTIWSQLTTLVSAANRIQNWMVKNTRDASQRQVMEVSPSTSSTANAAGAKTVESVFESSQVAKADVVLAEAEGQRAENGLTDQRHIQQQPQQPQKQPNTDSTVSTKRQKEHFRYMRTLAFILCAFMMLSGPITCCSLYSLLTNVFYCAGSPYFDSFAYTAPYFHVGVNPILVIVAQRDFRRAIWALFSRRK